MNDPEAKNHRPEPDETPEPETPARPLPKPSQVQKFWRDVSKARILENARIDAAICDTRLRLIQIGHRHGLTEQDMIDAGLLHAIPETTTDGCLKGGHRETNDPF